MLFRSPNNAGKLRLFPDDIQTRMKAYSLYARDRWQITPKLTFNYGVRVELFPFPRRVGRGLEVYDFDKNVMLLCGLGPNRLGRFFVPQQYRRAVRKLRRPG